MVESYCWKEAEESNQLHRLINQTKKAFAIFLHLYRLTLWNTSPANFVSFSIWDLL